MSNPKKSSSNLNQSSQSARRDKVNVPPSAPGSGSSTVPSGGGLPVLRPGGGYERRPTAPAQASPQPDCTPAARSYADVTANCLPQLTPAQSLPRQSTPPPATPSDFIELLSEQFHLIIDGYNSNKNWLSYRGAVLKDFTFRFEEGVGLRSFDGVLGIEEESFDVSVLMLESEDNNKKRALEYFLNTSSISHEYIGRPWTHYFCIQREIDGLPPRSNLAHGFWSVVYSRFSLVADLWFRRMLYPKKESVKSSRGCLVRCWRENFLGLIRAIKCMHDSGLFHGRLKLSCSYVFCEDKLKIVNIGGKLNELSPGEQPKKKYEDFIDLGRFLSGYFGDEEWSEMKMFLANLEPAKLLDFPSKTLFSAYREKLLNNYFLKDARDRLVYFSEIQHKSAETCRRFGYRVDNLTIASRNGVFDDYLDWNSEEKKKTWSPIILDVYNHEKKSGEKTSYDGNHPIEILRLVRNIYQHFYERSNLDVEVVDEIVRATFGPFLDLVHLYC